MDFDIMDIRGICVICLTILAVAALIIDGSMGETLLVAISGFFGIIVGWGFGKASVEGVEEDAEEVQESGKSS